MMKAASRWEVCSFGPCLVALGCCVAALPALGQESGPVDGAATAVEALRAEQPVRLEVQASQLPRLEAQESGFRAPRVDVALFPPGSPGVGVAVGVPSLAPRAGAVLPHQFAQRPAVDVGLTWRHRLEGDQQIDVTAWRRMQPEPAAYTLAQQRQPVYGARFEMKMKPSKGLAFDRGFVGLQLEGDARISIRRKNGGPMIYYRNTF